MSSAAKKWERGSPLSVKTGLSREERDWEGTVGRVGRGSRVKSGDRVADPPAIRDLGPLAVLRGWGQGISSDTHTRDPRT
jgi:hypothetical protein